MIASSTSVIAFSVARMSITSTTFRLALVAVALVIAALMVRMIRRHRIVLSVVLGAVTLALVASNVGAAINAHYDYLPSLQSLSSSYRGEDQANWSDARAARAARADAQRTVRGEAQHSTRSPVVTSPTGHRPVALPPRTVNASRPAAPVARAPEGHGLLVRVSVPGVISGYHPRSAEIYLPPAWVSDPSVRLPVLFLLHGTPGSPVDWARSVRADRVSDRWAAGHHGLAPILVMPDINGSFLGDSECTDGTAGNVDTYVATDVANWVTSHLHPSLDHGQWGVGGLSEGGTCAVSLALRHPTVFKTFLDYSGEDHVSHRGGALSMFPGTIAQRRVQLAAYNPYALAGHLANPQQTAGWFEVGANDRRMVRQMRGLETVMAGRGLEVQFHLRPGSHNFRFWRASFAGSYEWMATRLGTDGRHGAPVGRVPAGHSVSRAGVPASGSSSAGSPRHATVEVADRPPRSTR